ncbi:MAG: c-type cytochrome biogenesis protein CcmI, partial [Pseudolabrys sp.]
MTLWLILALMTGAAIFAVIWPLAQNSKAARSGSDVAVYRDQLNELERDLAAGSIGKTEAEAARVEISRRLLAAA